MLSMLRSRASKTSLQNISFVYRKLPGVSHLCQARAQARAQAGPKPGPKPGPSQAQAGPKPDFWEFRNLGPGNLGKLGSQKIQTIKILKIKIRVAQKVGKVWISRKKTSWPHLGPSGPIFCVGRTNRKKIRKNCLFSLVGQWALFNRFGMGAPHGRPSRYETLFPKTALSRSKNKRRKYSTRTSKQFSMFIRWRAAPQVDTITEFWAT